MSRRFAAAAFVSAFGLAPALVPALVAAQSAKAAPAQGPRQIEVKRIFPYFDRYLALPAELKDGFRLEYAIVARDRAAGAPTLTYVLGDRRVPVRLDAGGRVLNPPDRALFDGGVIEASGGAGGIRMSPVPIVARARTVPTAAVTNALSDWRGALGRTAGPLALAAPRFSGVSFKGARSGVAVFADGRRVPLPLVAGAPTFKPNERAMRGATAVELDTDAFDAAFAD